MSFPMEGDSSSNSMPKTELEEKDDAILAQEHVRRAQLKMQFHGTRKGEDQTIEAYVKQLKSIADSLATSRSPILDSDLVLQLLAGLPSQYLPFQKTISSQFPLPTFSATCSMLDMYEKLLQEQTNPTSNIASPKTDNSSCKSSSELEEGKETLDTILAIFNRVSSVASTAWELWNVFGTSTTISATGNNKKYSKGPAGRGRNYNKRSGPSTNSRNSGRK